jgi:EAL domain-containing protein (putative c-di-GMP-specific phosphodiesterase class I)
MSLTDEVVRQRAHRTIIEALLAAPKRLGPDYQPVRRMDGSVLGEIVAFKATGRGQAGTELGDTLSLLHGAQALGLAERLDWAFRCLAFEQALDAKLDVELHITPEPETFGTPVPPRLAGVFIRGRRELRIGAEIHDYGFGDTAALTRAVDEFRDWGWRIILADVAHDERAVAQLPALAPDIVQVNVARRGGVGTPEVRRFVEAAQDCGAELMAVSIDRPGDKETALGLGVTYGRGRALGTPGPLPLT